MKNIRDNNSAEIDEGCVPALRPEVVIKQGGVDFGGYYEWLVHDTVTNKFIRIGFIEYQIAKEWHLGNCEDIIKAVEKNVSSSRGKIKDALKRMILLFRENNFVEQDLKDLHGTNAYAMLTSKSMIIKKLLLSYLFFRVPIWRPNAFLVKTISQVEWIFGKTVFLIMMLLLFIGITTLLPKLDLFLSNFQEVFTIPGLFYIAITIFVGKIFHELGHAYMCVKKGCYVPSIGVAFLVFWPVFYTDTRELWKLPSKKSRLIVSISGLWMEFYLAIIGLWLWLLLPPGDLRTAFFMVATINLLISILLNASPFLKFDGYYVLSDYIGARNLKNRSFKFCRWALRNLLFGLNLAPPEDLSRRKASFFIIYAFLSWLYRLVIFISISFIIYELFFKFIGFILISIAIFLLIIMPIIKEFFVWYKMRHQINLNKNLIISLIVTFLISLFLIVPWNDNLSIPAVLTYSSRNIYSQVPGKIESLNVSAGQKVRVGQNLVLLKSESLSYEEKLIEKQLLIVLEKIKQSSKESNLLSKISTYIAEKHKLKTELQAIREKLHSMRIKSPFSGTVISLSPSLKNGSNIRKTQFLMAVVNPNKVNLTGLVPATDVGKISVGTGGVFIPKNPSLSKINVILSTISHSPLFSLDAGEPSPISQSLSHRPLPIDSYYNSNLGGELPVRIQGGLAKPDIPVYKLYFDSDGEPFSLAHNQVGYVKVKVQGTSLIIKIFHALMSFLIKESQF